MQTISKEKSIIFIDKILEKTGLSRIQLSRKIGKPNAQWIADIYSPAKKGGISSSVAYALSCAFPELNLNTLVTGEGELFKDPIAEQEKTKVDLGPVQPRSSEKDRVDDFISIIKELVNQNADNIRIQEKHADAHVKNADSNLKNAEANKMHADNFSRLLDFLGSDKKKEYDGDGKPLMRDIP